MKCRPSYWQSLTHSTRSGAEKFGERSLETTNRHLLLANLVLVVHLHAKGPPSIASADTCVFFSRKREILRTRTYDVGMRANALKQWRPLYALPMSNWVRSDKSERYSAK